MEINRFWHLLLWSLFCELIYYTCYPSLHRIQRFTGWNWLILPSYALSIGLILAHPYSGVFQGLGVLDALLGLPCWLLGCQLAQQFDSFSTNPDCGDKIWYWRLGAWLGSSFCYGLMLHTPIGLRWSLLFFAIFAAFWLQQELIYYSTMRQ